MCQAFLPEALPEVGRRIRIVGHHPWVGCTAVVLSHEDIGLIRRIEAKVRLDDENHPAVPHGQECFVPPHMWRYEGKPKKKKAAPAAEKDNGGER